MAVEIVLLGVAQDGGLPQAGCVCGNCAQARREPHAASPVVSLGIIDHAAGAFFIVDATPDFPRQYEALARLAPGARLTGVLLTHAHFGHYTGLMYLGREVMNVAAVPIHASPRMAAFLAGNAPWSQLVDLGNVVPVEFGDGARVALTDAVSVQPQAVPHRAEFTDTFAFRIEGPRRRAWFCPDIDDWRLLAAHPGDVLRGDDVLLVDGTFFDAAELPGRNLAEIPHPLVTDTAAYFAGRDLDVTLVHLNHSNPLWRNGPERRWTYEHGLAVGTTGQRWTL